MSWWRKVDLVSTRTVGKTKRDGVTYREIPDPSEEERAMIIEALDAQLRGRNATSSTELGALARMTPPEIAIGRAPSPGDYPAYSMSAVV